LELNFPSPPSTLSATDRLCADPETRLQGTTGPPFAQADGCAERRGVDFRKSFDTFVLQLIFDGTKLLSRKKDALRLKKPHRRQIVVLVVCHIFIRLDEANRVGRTARRA
jgi:hypothetical protein